LGQTITTNTFNFTTNLVVPDGDLRGIAVSCDLSLTGTVTNVTVSLDLVGTGDGGFNGDMYASLLNSSGGFAVLLNRPGRTVGSDFGYSDNGFDVTFDDSASTDVHLYQTVPYTLNFDGQLTGTWQPDGRISSPLSVEDTDQQTAMLASFVGLPASGTWTLFLADASVGATEELVGWSLTIETIPEPSVRGLCLTGLILGAGVGMMRRNNSRKRVGS
jgi:subtilisin-like proprotein convertase family protein